MKKIYTLAIAFALFSSGLFAQSSNAALENKNDKSAPITTYKNSKAEKPSSDFNKDAQLVLWSDDFSDPSTWLIEHDATACSLDWEIGTGLSCGGSYPIDNIQSTTADNGFAMIDSDEYGGSAGGSEIEDSWFTNVTPIDLTDNPNVILQFESFYRYYSDEQCYVVISTNNTDWPELDPLYDAESNPNVFRAWPGVSSNQASIANPTNKRIDISAAAGGQSTVWIRFHWTGTWGYSWFVDDVAILEQGADDMTMEYTVVSHNGLGDEYGRVPLSQLDPTMNLAALSTNFGYLDQTDVITDVTIEDENGTEILSASSSVIPLVNPADSVTFETEETLPAMSVGTYTAIFTVTSAEEQDGDFFDSNVITRNFEITSAKYSLDGVGVYDNPILSSMGTNSFFEGEGADGFFTMTLYDLNLDENPVYGLEVLLDPATVTGGSIIAHVLDTADVLNDNIDNPIFSSDEYIVTQEDIDAGSAIIYFDQPEMLAAGSYYAGAELYSNGNQNDIRVVNDVTVPQPGNSSLIYIANDATYGNGVAFGVRLLMSGADAISEISNDAVLGNIAPNPAVDRTTVTFELLNSQNVSIVITDMLGKVVLEEKLGNLSPGNYSRVIKLNGLNAGSYHYSIVTENGSLSKAMQIVK